MTDEKRGNVDQGLPERPTPEEEYPPPPVECGYHDGTVYFPITDHPLKAPAAGIGRRRVESKAPHLLTGHKTEAVYRRYAIVSEGDLLAGVQKLTESAAGTIAGTVTRSA